jgi:aspartyl-tRNA(Asn)/glutamyl-tRNA(Gln) amidotransferase subunit B
VANNYKPTIGIECHVQLSTKTKLFAAVSNDAIGAEPNTLISHICLGMPGALPVLNEHAVELAMQAAFALNTQPQKFSKFDRKHYFYPDLPKGYQITQFDEPVILGGTVTFMIDGTEKTVAIDRAHLEEDAGKTSHPAGKEYSLVDLNRAGTPLLEVVSQPELHTAAEAKAFARELWLLMRYAGVSNANLFHGNMRFDVNVSVSKDPEVLGTRTETKNLNSFKSVEKAVEYETKRQIDLLEKGEQIVQETRGWDDAKQKTISQRSKEDAHDYRYFPDPDIPPVIITETAIQAVKTAMPAMPMEIRSKVSSLGIDSSSVETLLDEMQAGRFISEMLDGPTKPSLVKKIANWLVGDVQAAVSNGELSWDSMLLDEDSLTTLAEMTEGSKISSTGAKTVLLDLVSKGGNPESIAGEKNLLQVSDEGEINKIVKSIIDANPQAAEDVRSGEMKAIGYLVGQIMKESKGKANPGLAQKLVKEQLGV